jgi:hypothetical protein
VAVYAPCINDALVSYTYSNDDSNSGDITVPTVAGSSGKLCKSFYVTATSWSYTGNTVWPQTVDQVDHVNGTPVGASNIQISASGVYHYAAQITCGQGDIYASWTSNDATLFPENDNLPSTGYLAGPGNPLPEHFLHSMGFSGPYPTYRQDNTNCWTPTPETGVPTVTTLTCAVGSSNSLSLPAVPGGVWNVTNGSGVSPYNFTYPIGTGVYNWVPTNFTRAYTITLTDGNSSDGYDVTGTSTGWSPQNPGYLDCNQVITPVKPSVQTVQQCGVDGSFTVPTTVGVNYYLGGDLVHALTPGQVIYGTGPQLITAKPQSGYKFSTDPYDTEIRTWTLDLGDATTCPVSIAVGPCTADGAVSSVPVSVTLNNNSGSVSSSFEVKVEGTAFDQTFVVPAHTTVAESIGTSPSSGETVDVFINGSATAVVLPVASFVGCVITVIPGDPSVTQQTCDAATGTLSNDASITLDLQLGLIYSITGPGGFALSNVFGTSGQTVVATGLAPGDYVVSVAAAPGYILDPTLGSGSKWPFTITLAPTDCTVGVTVTPADCPDTNANTDNAAGTFTTTTTGVPSITVQLNSNVVYTAYENGSAVGQILTATTTDVSPGSWMVVVTLSATAGPQYKLTGGSVSFGPFNLTAFCPPPLATWDAGAAGANAVCSNGTTTAGVISLVHSAGQAGQITYKITNNTTNAVVYNSNLTSTVHVPAGSYTVIATPPLGDGISGNLQNNPGGTEIFPTITIGTISGTNCDPTSLAFTGGTIAWFGFVLAGGMLFLGIAFLLIRRRQDRIAE